MSTRANAEFKFAPLGVKVMALSADFSTPLPLEGGTSLSAIELFGGVGPFDFSGVALATAVEFKIKIDGTEDAVTTIDISAAVDQSAVTATELVSAITTAAYTNISAAVDSRGYVQVEVTTPGTNRYLQVYGEGAELAEFGQGYGGQFIYVDTQQSLSSDPTLKDQEAITITDSNGKDTEVLTDAYRKGSSGTFTDTARDPYLRALIEGGLYDETNDFYSAPTTEDDPVYFCMEVARAVFEQGTNKEFEYVGVLLERYYTCGGSIGTDPGDRNFAPVVYNYTATSYKDPQTGTIYADFTQDNFTRAEWDAFDWDGI